MSADGSTVTVAVELPATEGHRAVGRDERRRARLRVVGAEGGRAADREVHRQRAGGNAGAGEGVDQLVAPSSALTTAPPLLLRPCRRW